ncbi:MAG: hypothetical protein K1X89_17815 [Myxococcaceae bacterium]|nr:hypothetical protein [Myxococcaceae bacterium]
MTPRRLQWATLVLGLGLCAPQAFAQTPSEAERLFNEGRALEKAKRYREAVELFQQSQKLDPALGTLLNLAICLEEAGLAASAWVRFNEAEAWAKRTQESPRAELAHERALALKPRLSWLAVSAAQPVSGMLIAVGASELPGSTSPASVPVDPGPVLVTARAPGFAAWSAEVEAPAAGQTLALEVPALVEVTPVPVAALPTPAEVSVTPQAPRQRTWSIAGLVAGSALSIAGGIGLAWSLSTYGALQHQRLGVADGTFPVGESTLGTLRTVYPLSWVSLGLGVVLAAASGFVLGAW